MTITARPLRILIFAVLVTLCCGSCDTPTVYIMGGDRDTDSDTDVNSDSPVEADREFVDADIDLDDITDGAPAGPLTLILTNNGPDAAYVKYTRSSAFGLGNGGITVLDANGETMAANPGCTISCDDECSRILCEEQVPAVRQILPGDSMTLTWDGDYYPFEDCETNAGHTATCHRHRHISPGDYCLRFCYSFFLHSDWGMPQRLQEDILNFSRTGEQTCVDIPVSVTEEPQTLRHDFEADLGPNTKEAGYCGQIWTWPLAQPGFVLQGEPYSIPEGSSPVFLMGPRFDEAPPCWRWGEVAGWPQASDNTVQVYGSVFTGQRECPGGSFDKPLHAAIIPPLDAGDWTAYFGSYAMAMNRSHNFTVTPCPSCLECSDGEYSSLREYCIADCGCIDNGAVCDIRAMCMNYCLSSNDCPAGFTCRYSNYTAAAVNACTPLMENFCHGNSDCPKGYICVEDDNGHDHCRREFDTRIVAENHGQGIACGCDDECPGTQSCVRFEDFFTDGFCALICRDNRDCPENWECIGLTQSGIASICMPTNTPGR